MCGWRGVGYVALVVALRAVCVFCGSSSPADPRYLDAARALGALVAGRGVTLVYGGGSVGLMGEVADAALGHGGRVTGVIPAGLFAREVSHTGLTELHEVGSMHERKQLMYDLSDAFIALPGGLGTLEELAEVATWSQLGLPSRPGQPRRRSRLSRVPSQRSRRDGSPRRSASDLPGRQVAEFGAADLLLE